MAIRIDNSKNARAVLKGLMDGMDRSAVCARLDAMDAWELLLFDDPEHLSRPELEDIAVQLFVEIDPDRRESFLEAFGGGERQFADFMKEYRRGRVAPPSDVEMKKGAGTPAMKITF